MPLRPLRDTPDDLAALHRLRREAFGLTAPDPVADARARDRARHLVTTDPAGCWLAEEGGEPTGAVLSMRREGTWVVSLFVVAPAVQGKGIGRALLERADEYGRDCDRAMLCASSSPLAARRYRSAGFTLYPAMRLDGRVVRDLPAAGGIRTGTGADRDLLDAVDRRVRGAAHGPDHEFMLTHHDELLVRDDPSGTGYCYRDGGNIKMLAATDTATATDLLFATLARVPAEATAEIEYITVEQQWAVDAGMRAGLSLHTRGYLALRGMCPPTPYLPQPGFL